jgi:hypothetical protein
VTLEIFSFLQHTNIAVPLFQLGLLLLVSSLVLLFGWVRLALLFHMTFALYWGYLANREALEPAINRMGSLFVILYFGFGIAIVILALAGFFSHKD